MGERRVGIGNSPKNYPPQDKALPYYLTSGCPSGPMPFGRNSKWPEIHVFPTTKLTIDLPLIGSMDTVMKGVHTVTVTVAETSGSFSLLLVI